MSQTSLLPNAVNNDNSVGFFRNKISLEINLSTSNSGLVPIAIKLRQTKLAKWVGTEFYEDQLSGPKETLPLLDGFVRLGTTVTKKGKRVPNRIAAIVTLDIDNADHELLAERVSVVNEMFGLGLILSKSASVKNKTHAIVSAFDKDGKRVFLNTKLCAKAMATILGIDWTSVDQQGIERCFLTRSLFDGLGNGIHTPIDQASLLELARSLSTTTPIQNNVDLDRGQELSEQELQEQQDLIEEMNSGITYSQETPKCGLRVGQWACKPLSFMGERNGVKVYSGCAPDGITPIIVDERGNFVAEDVEFYNKWVHRALRHAVENGLITCTKDCVPFHEYAEVTRSNMLKIKEALQGRIPLIGKALDLHCLYVLFAKDGRSWLSHELGAAVLGVSVEWFYQIRKGLIRSGFLTQVEKAIANVCCARFAVDSLSIYLARNAAIEVKAEGILARYVDRNSDTLVSGAFNTHEYNMCIIAVTHDLSLEDVVAELSAIPDWFCERRLKRLASTFKWAQRKFL